VEAGRQTLSLRGFRASDDEALISWVRSAEELRMFAGDGLAWPLDSRQLELLRNEPELAAYTAELGGVVVGHFQLRRLPPGSARLARVIVDPKRRGEGLGRALVAAALDEARRRGFVHVDLHVYNANAAARALYASLGFDDHGPDRARPESRLMSRVL
jgi:ribosomal protein S18 acetylase RimI-like enzyme